MNEGHIVLESKYMGSFPSESSCPKTTLPEYAFIGRSNVGKSSLINMLTGKKDLARTSKTPGKTRSINLFEIDRSWILADLPGYGYAKISKSERKRWQQLIENYLQYRPNLICAFVLIDLRHPLQAIDQEFINWLGEKQVPFALVYTKADKITSAKVDSHLARIRSELLKMWEELPVEIITSSVTRHGREQLLQYITGWNEKLTAN